MQSRKALTTKGLHKSIPKKASRTEHTNFFDFNPRAHQRAAENISQSDLVAMFEKLDRADERLDVEREMPRGAALDALRAVVTLLTTQHTGRKGRFSRVFELLCTELSHAGAPIAGKILPAPPNGNGKESDAVRHHIQAAAAHAAQWLHETGMTVPAATGWVAGELERGGFDFTKRRSQKGKAKAVEAWRRDYPGLRPERNRTTSPVKAYHAYLKSRPSRTGDPTVDRERVRAWFYTQLCRAGYGAVA